jgi:hypothetical protein
MAEKLALAEPNVIDPRWILNEETGRLGYWAIRVVRSHPAQTLLMSDAAASSMEIADRYLRIMADKRRRAGQC